MSRLTEWMDTHLYPDHPAGWDHAQYRAYLLQRLKKEDRVLDLGAGRGAVPELNVQDQVAFVAGVDPDPAVFENPYLDEARLLDLPTGRIPYEDESFDVVMTANVLEHVQDPESAFREVYRVLKPGGIFISRTPNRWHYFAVIAGITPHAFHVLINKKRGRKEEDIFPTVYKSNSKQAILRHARRSGFEIVDFQSWEGRPEYLRMSSLLYGVGYLYERAVNTFDALEGLRCMLVFTLRRPA